MMWRRLGLALAVPWMAVLFAIPILTSGFAVAHVHDGLAGMRRSLLPVAATGGAMASLMWLLNIWGAPQISSALPGLVGCLVIWLVARGGLAEAWPGAGAGAPAAGAHLDATPAFHDGALQHHRDRPPASR